MRRVSRSVVVLDRNGVLSAFDAVPIAVGVVRGPECRLDYANPAFRELFVGPAHGRLPARNAGTPGMVPELAPVRLGDRLLVAVQRVAATGETFCSRQEPIELISPGEQSPKTRYFDISCSRIGDAPSADCGVLTVAVEVTERVVADRELLERDRQEVLAEATEAMHRSLEPSDELRALAWAAVPELADVSIVHRLKQSVRPGQLPRSPITADRVAVACAACDSVGLSSAQRDLCWDDASVLTRAVHAGDLVWQSVDAASPPAWVTVLGLDMLLRRGMHTVAAAPVIVEDEVVAVVLFGCLARRPPWSPDERAVLSQIARNAGHALGHGLSYQQTRESALTLQHSLLTRPPTVDGLEICARYEPAGADAVGGDWYDAFSLGTDNLAVVIGDVVGHDMSAAAAMGQLRATLRGLALDRAENPASILDRLDRVAQQLAITSFTSVVYGRLDRAGTHAWRLRWANAGHPPPLLLGQDGSARWLDDVGGLVLGTGLPGRARTDADVRLLAGDTVLLYTDGLVERRDRPIDVGMDNLVELVTTRGRSASLDELCDLLMRSTPADDDVAILAVRVTRPACFHAR